MAVALGHSDRGGVGARSDTELRGFRLLHSAGEGEVLSASARGQAIVGLGPRHARELSNALGGSGDLSVSVAEGHRRWGSELWRRLRSRYAALVFDAESRSLRLACDPLGPGTLFYIERDGLVIVSDRIETLLNRPETSWSLVPGELARFFSVLGPRRSCTFFEGIREVPRGTAIEFDESSTRAVPFWRPEAIRPERGRTDAACAEAFADLIRSAISEMAGNLDEVGVMLSGGLDSTTLACLSADLAAPAGGRVGACSWVFDQLAQCDERDWIELTLESADFEVIQTAGDRHWTLSEPDEYCELAGTPEENPYRSLKTALYREAVSGGRRVLFNGGPADILQRQTNLYLRDLLLEGRFRTAGACLARHARRDGLRAASGAIARVVRPSGRGPAGPHTQWLTREARAFLKGEYAEAPVRAPGHRDVVGYLDLQARGQNLEHDFAGRQGVEVLSPFWNLDFVEFMLALPAHQVFRPGRSKLVGRNAAQGLIPETIRLRQEPTHLDPLFDLGVFDRRARLVQDLLHGEGAIWPRFLEKERIRSVGVDSKPIEKVLLWRCLSLELWRRRHGWGLA